MGAGAETVTHDGSPVWAYLALPAGEAPEIVHRAVRPGGSILELGCGAGRLTRPLVAFGHCVLAVDDTPDMLAHVTGAETLDADLFSLDLDRRFDAVLAASHLVDVPERSQRLDLLRVCRRHVADDGVVVIQRHDPEWAAAPADSSGMSGPVGVEFRLLAHHGDTFEASVTYRLGERSSTQTFTAAVTTDELLARDAAECGLPIDRWLDERRAWGVLRPVPDPSPGSGVRRVP